MNKILIILSLIFVASCSEYSFDDLYHHPNEVTYETRESDVPFSGTAVSYSGSQLTRRANYEDG